MWSCSHRKKHLITETDYRGAMERIYSCQYCGAIIAEPIETTLVKPLDMASITAYQEYLEHQHKEGAYVGEH